MGVSKYSTTKVEKGQLDTLLRRLVTTRAIGKKEIRPTKRKPQTIIPPKVSS